MLKAEFPEVSHGGVEDYESAIKERRIKGRAKTVYRLVKVEHNGDEGLARCHNISDSGMKLNISVPLNLNDLVAITFSTIVLNGRVVWVNGKDCGVAFAEPVDCASLLRSAPPDGAPLPGRAPRLTANLPATIAYQGKACEIVVNDISVRGMKIANDGNFHPGLKVRVIFDNGYEKEGVVRWSRDNIAGVMLLEPFNVDDLGSVRRLRRPPV